MLASGGGPGSRSSSSCSAGDRIVSFNGILTYAAQRRANRRSAAGGESIYAELGLCIGRRMIFNLSSHIFPFGNMRVSGCLVVGVVADLSTDAAAARRELVVNVGNCKAEVLI